MARRPSLNPVTGLPREALARRLARYLWMLATDPPTRHVARLRLFPARGVFQPFNTTWTNRYPHIFDAAARILGLDAPIAILSFGCSTGEEVFTLRHYFPRATLKGVDINRANILRARARLAAAPDRCVTFEVGAETAAEADLSYDAIFCLAVLRDGRLTRSRPPDCRPLLDFADFAVAVADFHRCLKPGGLLALCHTNFRLADTPYGARFETMLRAPPDAPLPLYDADNKLMPGEVYHDILFRKVG